MLYKILTNKKYFANYSNISNIEIVIGGDHIKGKFTMLLTMYNETWSCQKYYLDEIIGKVTLTDMHLSLLSAYTNYLFRRN